MKKITKFSFALLGIFIVLSCGLLYLIGSNNMPSIIILVFYLLSCFLSAFYIYNE